MVVSFGRCRRDTMAMVSYSQRTKGAVDIKILVAGCWPSGVVGTEESWSTK